MYAYLPFHSALIEFFLHGGSVVRVSYHEGSILYRVYLKVSSRRRGIAVNCLLRCAESQL